MGYGTDGLTFRTLKDANDKRRPYFHPKGSAPWIPAQWLQAVVGELGEYANLRKKVERGDFGPDLPAHIHKELSNELADVGIYLDLLAQSVHVDLGRAIVSKWNQKSEELRIPLYIDAEDWHYRYASKEEPHCMKRAYKSDGKPGPCSLLLDHAGDCI